MERSHRSYWTLALLTAFLLLAAGLRFYHLGTQSFWNDEGNSARIAERPVGAIIAGAAGDIHPPGYYLLLAGWRSAVGHSEFALRMLSALAGVLTVAVIYAAGRDLFDRRVGILGALLAAISPFQVYYGQEARMYALVALWSVLSIWLAAKVLEIPGEMVAGKFRPRRALLVIVAYMLVTAAGYYTHYSFPLVILGESLVFLVWLARRKKKLHGLAVWFGVQIVPLILFAPWIPIAIRQITSWPTGGGEKVTGLALLSSVVYGSTLPPDAARIGLLPLLVLALIGLLPPVDDEDARYLAYGERAGFVLAQVVAPIGALMLAKATSQPFLKFLLPANLALCLLVARSFIMGIELSQPIPLTSRVNNLFTRLTITVLAILAFFPWAQSLNGLYTDPAYQRDDYRAIAARIESEAGPDAAVILDAPNQWEVFTYYYPDGPGVSPLPNDATETSVTKLLDSYGRIYALYWGAAQQDPNDLVRSSLASGAIEAGADWYGGVQLVTYAVTGGPASSMEQINGATFGANGEIVLEGFTISRSELSPGDGIGVTLFWHAAAPIDARYKVFVHLYGPDGAVAAQHDSEPGENSAPTDGWIPDQTVIDAHGLLLPLDAATGTYQLAIGLYRPEDGTRLPTSTGEDPLLLQDIIVR